jgi:indolepyruvate ferredoxin oxidoreductase, alpha subunit
MGDGGFWHNGLTSGIGNAVFNKRQRDRSSSTTAIRRRPAGRTSCRRGRQPPRSTTSIEKAVRGVGVKWVRTHRPHLRRGADARHAEGGADHAGGGPKVIVAQSECMLNKQRREKPLQRPPPRGERVVRERFGVDPDTCTGDHSCIRLSGCPSLTIKPNPDPLRRDPVTKVIDSCVGCGLCGEVAHAAVLCPSFYRASIVTNPTGWDRFKARMRDAVIGSTSRR